MSKASEPAYGVHVEQGVTVPMRDGVLLAADVYLPVESGAGESGRVAAGPFPTVLERTPYDKRGTGGSGRPRPETGRYFASRGYAAVFQDVRGRFDSQGAFVKYLDDPADGYDTVEWIARQAWSNGRVGTFGLSYGAHTQASLAAANPPHLSCMFLDSGGFTNAYDNSCRNSGAFELRQVCWAFTQAKVGRDAAADPTVRAALEAEDLRDWFRRMPWRRGHSPLRWAPEYEEYVFDMWTRADFDDYWKQMGVCNELYFEGYADVPQLHMGSWYDPYTRTTTRNYTGLSPMKRGPVRLLMGPWTHGASHLTHSGDVDFGPDATVGRGLGTDYDELRLRWFDRWLKDVDNGVDQEPPVRVFVMGGGDGRKNGEGRLGHGGRWRGEAEWPPARARYTNFYIQPDGSLTTEPPTATASGATYQFDPTKPVPTIGGNVSSGADVMEGGAFHQEEGPRFLGSREPYLPLGSRPDVLVFQTPPLEEDVEVTGPVSAVLWVSSSAPDTDFTAKLVDCHPPNEDYPRGFDMNVSDGIIRARYRESFESPEPMTPGEVYRLTIELYPTANLFCRGHRIRLDISSSNFPRLDVNPNTGEAPGLSRRTVVAENTVYHDARRPSHVVLPVVPPPHPTDSAPDEWAGE